MTDVPKPSAGYLTFDKRTGRILHRYSRFSVETNDYSDVPPSHIRSMLAMDPAMIETVPDRDVENLGILQIADSDVAVSDGGVMVDVESGTIVPLPTLSLTADKREIHGDGRDSTVIDIELGDAGGKRVSEFNGRIKVTTTRGKLSALGGLVDLVHGRASLTLTSVAETVSVVQVAATSLDGLCADGYLTLEFL